MGVYIKLYKLVTEKGSEPAGWVEGRMCVCHGHKQFAYWPRLWTHCANLRGLLRSILLVYSMHKTYKGNAFERCEYIHRIAVLSLFMKTEGLATHALV